MPCVTLDAMGHVDPEHLRLLRIGSRIRYFYLSGEDETMCNESCVGTVTGFEVDAKIRGRAYTLTADVREQIDSGEFFYWLDNKKLTKILGIKVISNGIRQVLDTEWLRIETICTPRNTLSGPQGGGRGRSRTGRSRRLFNGRSSGRTSGRSSGRRHSYRHSHIGF